MLCCHKMLSTIHTKCFATDSGSSVMVGLCRLPKALEDSCTSFFALAVSVRIKPCPFATLSTSLPWSFSQWPHVGLHLGP